MINSILLILNIILIVKLKFTIVGEKEFMKVKIIKVIGMVTITQRVPTSTYLD